jgi:DNA adenine methylase
MRYPGGKNACGTYQQIINQIPPHRVYVEPFAGSAAIARLKRPALRTILIDRDPEALAALAGTLPPKTAVLEADGIGWLERMGPSLTAEAFVYCDPPYLASAVRSRLRYRYVLADEDHGRLLKILRGLKCHVMISGYWSPGYAKGLPDWRTLSFPQMTRGGYSVDEWLWMNYPDPMELHDYKFLGNDYRERENLAKRKRRWTARLARMTPLERRALLAALAEVDGPGATAGNGGVAGGTARNGEGARVAAQPGATAGNGGLGRHRRK